MFDTFTFQSFVMGQKLQEIKKNYTIKAAIRISIKLQ